MSNIYLDREEASKLLKVSTRTIDRYVRKFRLKIRKEGRKVLIKRNDVDKIIQEHLGQFMDISSTNLDTMLDKKTVHNKVSNMSNIKVKNVTIDAVKNEVKNKEDFVEDSVIYKNLFEETRKELREKQERLEAATYRVGQLEAQVKNMVPLLDYNRKEKEVKEVQMALEQKAVENQQTIEKMQKKLKAERIAKWIYISLVGTLLVAEPVLFLLWAFS